MAEMTPQAIAQINALIDEMNRQRVTGQAMPDPRLSFAGPAPSTAQNLMDAMAMPAQMATGVAMQPVRAGEAIGTAAANPTIPNLTSAGIETGLTFLRPGMVLKSAGAGYGAAAAKDAGLFDAFAGPANAAKGDKDAARAANAKAAASKAEGQAAVEKAKAEAAILKAKTEAERLAAETRLKEEEAKARLAREAADKAEYDRAVKTAETRRDEIRATDKSFKDSNVGQVYEKTGGLAPMLAGTVGGMVHRLASGAPKGAIDKYLMPAVEGSALTFAGLNAPLVYDALSTPVKNPQREALEVYSRELPQGHPNAAKAASDAQGMSEINPVSNRAWSELTDPMGQVRRAGTAIAEGAPAGLFGRNMPEAGAAAVRGVGMMPGLLAEGYQVGMGRAAAAKAARNPASASSGGTGASGAGPGQAGIPPNAPAGPLANTQGNYPKPGTPERGYIRDEYRGAVLDAGGPLDPRSASRTIQTAAQNQGGKLRGMEARISETNNNIKAFEAQHGRLPISKKEFEDFIFKNTKTLGLLGAMGLGSALSQPTD